MNISLTPALEKFVNDKVATGLYNSVSEVIREAIRLLISKESVSQEQLIKLNRDIEEGLNDSVVFDGQEAMKNLMKQYE
ncbi:MAG: type II toxin-antitoxin system ParD family antitoxin [bacterium]|nr:type II toxin-antitoxin system ParD family antitoxin [bacterium]